MSKRSSTRRVPSDSSANNPVPFEGLIRWLEAAAVARGIGGKAQLAQLLGITPSNLSKILNRRGGFDEKTVRLMSLIESSKAEKYDGCPVVKKVEMNGLIIESRDLDGEEIYTWRVAP